MICVKVYIKWSPFLICWIFGTNGKPTKILTCPVLNHVKGIYAAEILIYSVFVKPMFYLLLLLFFYFIFFGLNQGSSPTWIWLCRLRVYQGCGCPWIFQICKIFERVNFLIDCVGVFLDRVGLEGEFWRESYVTKIIPLPRYKLQTLFLSPHRLLFLL